MPIEEWTGPMTARDKQWSRIRFIVQKRVPFPDEKPRRAKVYAASRGLRFWRVMTLYPVAFMANVTAFGMMGVVSVVGSIYPYLFVDAEGRLVRRVDGGRRVRYVRVTNPLTITEDDLHRLEIGVQGKDELVDAQYEEAVKAAIAEVSEFM